MKAIEFLKQTSPNEKGARADLQKIRLRGWVENIMVEYAEHVCIKQKRICANKVSGLWTESELIDRILESKLPELE